MRTTALLAALCSLLLMATAAAAKGRDPRGAMALRRLSHCNDFESYDEIGTMLSDLAAQYPDIARFFTIGASVEGRSLFALRVSADPDEESAEPEIRIIGAIHGNECMAAKNVLNTIEWLTQGYGEDSFVSDLVDNTEIVLIPLVNPDGYDGEYATRENANNVDLNYNMRFAWIDVGPYPFSEPETRAIRDLSQANNFTIGISYHTVADYVNSAWNYSPYHPPDADLLQAMGEAYAGDSGYLVTFGWDWYNIQGDINDWSLGTQGTFDWTLELRSDEDAEWPVHMNGLEAFSSFVFQGIEGVITDRRTAEPVRARIIVSPDGVPVFNDPDLGDYHRVLLPGQYDLTIMAPGYQPLTVKDLSVTKNEVTRVDVTLSRLPEESERYAFAVTGMTLPEPITTWIYDTSTYPNDTMVWDALGPSDGVFYSLSAHGSVLLDMGEAMPVVDQEGSDLRIVSGTGSADPVSLSVGQSQDGPFAAIATGEGTFEADIADSGYAQIRYVQLIDLGDSPFDAENPGYDLDAVVVIGDEVRLPDTGEPKTDGGVDSDTGALMSTDNEGMDTGQDAGVTYDTDSEAKWRAMAGDCSCGALGRTHRSIGSDLIRALF